MDRLDEHFSKPEIYKHSVTVLEIGAGPVQPLARELAELFLQNDKYRCCLIRINPVRERRSQYQYERERFEQFVKDNQMRPIEEFNLTAENIPNFLEDDVRAETLDEEKRYTNLKNDLIEIELPAKEALPLLLQSMQEQRKKMKGVRASRV